MGKALGGGTGGVLLSWFARDRKLVNQWASDHCHTLAGGTSIRALDMQLFKRLAQVPGGENHNRAMSPFKEVQHACC